VITDAVLHFFTGLVNVCLGWLPSTTPPNLSADITGISVFWRYFGWLNQYLPVSETVGFISVAMVVYAAMYLFRAAVWVLTKAHILGGASD
jgi:hypothetical protein